jgi:hypothetical protein
MDVLRDDVFALFPDTDLNGRPKSPAASVHAIAVGVSPPPGAAGDNFSRPSRGGPMRQFAQARLCVPQTGADSGRLTQCRLWRRQALSRPRLFHPAFRDQIPAAADKDPRKGKRPRWIRRKKRC